MLISKFHLRISTNYFDTTERSPRNVSDEAMSWETNVLPNLGDTFSDLEVVNHQLIACIEAYRNSALHCRPDAPLYIGMWFESNAEEGEYEVVFEPEKPDLKLIKGGKDD